ncbi:MAG: hypothetical protein WD036_07345 [Bauldia sp.]
MKTGIQRAFAPFKVLLPEYAWRPIRAVATALTTPVVFSQWSGHFRSSLREEAVSRRGEPLPWYSYPCIHLLMHRDFAGRSVLEFGGGQSTLWWAARAERVVTFEGDVAWHARLAKVMPENVELHLISSADRVTCLAEVTRVLDRLPRPSFDVAVIDGDFREDVFEPAIRHLSEDGALICDDAESYGFFEATRGLDIQRADFFGHAPGVVLPRCTSVFFHRRCFLFDAGNPIPDLAKAL